MRKGSGNKGNLSRTRREFLKQAGRLGVGLGAAVLFGPTIIEMMTRHAYADANIDACFDGRCGRVIYGKKLPYEHVADHWVKLDDNTVQCFHARTIASCLMVNDAAATPRNR